MNVCGIFLLVLIFLPIPLWVCVLSNINYYWDYFESQLQDPLPDEYDFIVVGSGSSGSAVVNRLSKHNKVLLIEGGGEPIWLHKVPAFTPFLMHEHQVSYNYKTVPQTGACLGQKNNQSLWPRGKSLGGSSNLNFMLHVRSSHRDYDNWAEMTGDDGWNYKNLMPFFKKAIAYDGFHKSNKTNYGDSPYATMHVQKSKITLLGDELDAAFAEVGIPNKDMNSYQETSINNVDMHQKDGRRWDSYEGYIKPILSRKNLYITKYSQAVKIKLDRNNRAVGVWYVKNGVKRFARARKEVVVSAGAVDSPKLLMLSGIGPKRDLRSVGITPKVNVPVGKNLQDHLLTVIPNIVINAPLSYNAERDFGLHEVLDFLNKGDGFFAGCGLMPRLGFYTTNDTRKIDGDWPDVQFYFMINDQYSAMPEDFETFYGLNPDHVRSLFQNIPGQYTFAANVALVRPMSKGEIVLQDKDPNKPPLIDPRYLRHPDDIKAFIEGYKVMYDVIHNTETFKKLGARIPEESPLEPCKQHKFNSEAYWECYARFATLTIYHPVGTCKMGRPSDQSTVVDTQLRVLKTIGLRVADASIMPKIVNGNTHTPSIVIGEKAADLIREYWTNQYAICRKLKSYFDLEYLRTCQYSRFA